MNPATLIVSLYALVLLACVVRVVVIGEGVRKRQQRRTHSPRNMDEHSAGFGRCECSYCETDGSR